MAVSFERIKEYLEAIAAHAGAVEIENSPHGAFWRVDRNTFVAASVPNVSCHTDSGPVPIKMVAPGDAVNSALLRILTMDRAVCGKRQMPRGGPFVSDPGYEVTLSNNETVTGVRVQSDITDWILAGCPD